MSLLPVLESGGEGKALSFPEGSISYRDLRGAALSVAQKLEAGSTVAVWAAPRLDTAVAIVGAVLGGAIVVPVNPKLGSREIEHVLADSEPSLILAPDDEDLPAAFKSLRRIGADPSARGSGGAGAEVADDAPLLILYTSGTTGAPKGVVLSRRAVRSNLDALAEAWEWTDTDVLVHALPFFHAHGLVLGLFGPLRVGGELRHVGRFAPDAVARALVTGGTMLFAVPTMYRRLADASEQERGIAFALRKARLLVSGSAALPVREYERIAAISRQRIVERYGLTETLMNCSVRADSERRGGYVGPPLPGIEVKLVDEIGSLIEASDDETIGEVHVRGPNLFSGYLNRPDATEAVMRDGWFATGDLATRAADGWYRIVGRLSTDLIKTGGYKVGAGEVEAALLEHAGVAEAAVTGEADEDLGERIVAWVVPREYAQISEEELVNHVAALLAPHKRPRQVHFLSELPRTEMGKVQKARLRDEVGAVKAEGA